ncbi:MAG: potassium-transporting ATPase subunit KdpC [Thermoanaerobaculia bacterium]|nr:potassium-transporting ATPase subunit KdpC [Thermoanaerobaculia bacterium]
MKLILKSSLYVVATTILLSVVYPLAVTGLAFVFWPGKARGSFVEANGRVVGSELIGQSFSGPRYLRPRASAAGKGGYDGTSSGGTNKGPTSDDLAKAIAASVEKARLEAPGKSGAVPADLATTSASGLDPHLSPDAARWQAARIAAARGVLEKEVLDVIERHVEGRTLGLMGEPRVNVLLTNLDFDRSFPAR